MSYIKKRQKEIINNDLELEDYDEKHVFVKLTNSNNKDFWDDNLYDVNAIWKKKGWIVNKNNLDKLKLIMNMSYDSDDMSTSEHSSERKHNDYSDDESSSTDDELIQKALTRRLMSESTQKEIDADRVDDSELEDVVSVCRRFRFLYREIKMLKQRIAELEKRI